MEKNAERYIDLLKDGDWDRAFRGLIEEGEEIVTALAEAFVEEQDPEVRAALVQSVGSCGRRETAPFLSRAVDYPDPRVWKAALDGLVAVGGEPAREALESAGERFKGERRGPDSRAEWIAEALQQVQDLPPVDQTAAAELTDDPQPGGRSREELISFFEKMGYVNLTSPEEFALFMDYVGKNNIPTSTNNDRASGMVTVHKRMLGTIEGFPAG